MVVSDLMGHSPAKVDQKGRIKVPTAFRSIMEDRYGNECFITSINGDRAMIYPLQVWREWTSRISRIPTSSIAKQKILERSNYFGQLGTIDSQGRLLIPQILRQEANLEGEVVVLGNVDHLVVWSNEKIVQRIEQEPLTDEDYKELELHGV